MEDLIEYELINHECYYTGDFSEILDIVHSYYKNLSMEEVYNKVRNVFNLIKNKKVEDFDNENIKI